MTSFLADQDSLIYKAITSELGRQQHQLEMIASENFTSLAVMEAQGSVLTNKYAEGYPGRRYYGGCEFVDQVEQLAIQRACALFDCEYANVQPHSGAQANQEVFFALLNPGDTFMGMSLDCGGHLSHGLKVNLSGKWFKAVGYDVDEKTGLIDYDQAAQRARQYQPKVIIAGASAYAREIDFAWFRQLADEVGAYLMVDMAHFAGLVAGGAFPSPLPHAHVVTSTTHKTLRGPRGGLILSKTKELEDRLNSAVFPGTQGGPLMHVIAAKAVAFQEALNPTFKDYAHQIVRNARALADTLQEQGLTVTSGGTDCHLVLVDLRSLNLTGDEASRALEEAGITCNKNNVPFDPLPPQKTSGIRLGSPALTTRGMKEAEFKIIGGMIVQVLKNLSSGQAKNLTPEIKTQVRDLCNRFPLYPELNS